MPWTCEICNETFNHPSSYKCKVDRHNDTLKHKIKVEPSVKGYVYQCSHKTNKYIGSCFNIEMRKAEHMADSYNPKRKNYTMPFYKYIRDENITFDDLTFEILKEVEIECKCKTETEVKSDLHQIEQNYMVDIQPSLNNSFAKGCDKEKQKNATEKHKQTEKYQTTSKKWRSEMIKCNECGLEMTKNSKRRHTLRFHSGVEVKQKCLNKKYKHIIEEESIPKPKPVITLKPKPVITLKIKN